MVDWKSPAETAKYALAFDRFVHALLGLYSWECFISLDFDWQFISGKRRFRWPMIFYFLNRYFMLLALIGLVIGLDVTREINCKALYAFNTVTGASAIGLASINLSLRAIAVWNSRWYIVVPLVLIILGQFVLLMHVLTLNAVWIDGKGCVISSTDNPMLMAAFIYTMIFDFIILSLMSVKLLKSSVSGPKSKLRTLIFNDGLIFFLVAFLSNSVATTFIALKLNPIMSVIANLPATILSTIVACRVVRRLNNYSSSGLEVFPTAQTSSGLRGVRPNVSTVPKDGIHVQMETFPSPGGDAKATILKFDSDQVRKHDMFDPESQAARDGFNGPRVS